MDTALLVMATLDATRPPANANDISTHPQNIIPSNAPIYFYEHMHRSKMLIPQMVDVKSVEKTIKAREGKMRTWRKPLALENSDTGIVCSYIQDTSEIAKFPWTTQIKQTKTDNTVSVPFTSLSFISRKNKIERGRLAW